MRSISRNYTGTGEGRKGYCECSAGWYTRLFSEVFGKSVTVRILDTIVNGATECTFEISEYE